MDKRPVPPQAIALAVQLAAMSKIERAEFYANAVRKGASIEILRILHDFCAPDGRSET